MKCLKFTQRIFYFALSRQRSFTKSLYISPYNRMYTFIIELHGP